MVTLEVYQEVCKERDELLEKCSNLEKQSNIFQKGNEILKQALGKEKTDSEKLLLKVQ